MTRHKTRRLSAARGNASPAATIALGAGTTPSSACPRSATRETHRLKRIWFQEKHLKITKKQKKSRRRRRAQIKVEEVEEAKAWVPQKTALGPIGRRQKRWWQQHQLNEHMIAPPPPFDPSFQGLHSYRRFGRQLLKQKMERLVHQRRVFLHQTACLKRVLALRKHVCSYLMRNAQLSFVGATLRKWHIRIQFGKAVRKERIERGKKLAKEAKFKELHKHWTTWRRNSRLRHWIEAFKGTKTVRRRIQMLDITIKQLRKKNAAAIYGIARQSAFERGIKAKKEALRLARGGVFQFTESEAVRFACSVANAAAAAAVAQTALADAAAKKCRRVWTSMPMLHDGIRKLIQKLLLSMELKRLTLERGEPVTELDWNAQRIVYETAGKVTGVLHRSAPDIKCIFEYYARRDTQERGGTSGTVSNNQFQKFVSDVGILKALDPQAPAVPEPDQPIPSKVSLVDVVGVYPQAQQEEALDIRRQKKKGASKDAPAAADVKEGKEGAAQRKKKKNDKELLASCLDEALNELRVFFGNRITMPTFCFFLVHVADLQMQRQRRSHHCIGTKIEDLAGTLEVLIQHRVVKQAPSFRPEAFRDEAFGNALLWEFLGKEKKQCLARIFKFYSDTKPKSAKNKKSPGKPVLQAIAESGKSDNQPEMSFGKFKMFVNTLCQPYYVREWEVKEDPEAEEAEDVSSKKKKRKGTLLSENVKGGNLLDQALDQLRNPTVVGRLFAAAQLDSSQPAEFFSDALAIRTKGQIEASQIEVLEQARLNSPLLRERERKRKEGLGLPAQSSDDSSAPSAAAAAGGKLGAIEEVGTVNVLTIVQETAEVDDGDVAEAAEVGDGDVAKAAEVDDLDVAEAADAAEVGDGDVAEAAEVGDGIVVETAEVGDGIVAEAAEVGDGILVETAEVGDGILVETAEVGDLDLPEMDAEMDESQGSTEIDQAMAESEQRTQKLKAAMIARRSTKVLTHQLTRMMKEQIEENEYISFGEFVEAVVAIACMLEPNPYRTMRWKVRLLFERSLYKCKAAPKKDMGHYKDYSLDAVFLKASAEQKRYKAAVAAGKLRQLFLDTRDARVMATGVTGSEEYSGHGITSIISWTPKASRNGPIGSKVDTTQVRIKLSSTIVREIRM